MRSTRGATTIWERWNGIEPNGAFFNPAMNSFNHYAYGAIGDWLYRIIGGVDGDATSPGDHHMIVRPQPGAMSRGRTRHCTRFTGPLM